MSRLNKNLYSYFDDFIAASNETGEVGALGWNANRTTGAYESASPTDGQPGVFKLTPHTASTWFSFITMSAYAPLTDFARFGATFKVNAFTGGTGDTVEAGLMDVSSAIVATFHVNAAVSNEIKFTMDYVTYIPLGVNLVVDEYVTCEMEIDYARGVIDLFINGVKVKTISASIPWTTPVSPLVNANCTSLTTLVLSVDEVGFTMYDHAVAGGHPSRRLTYIKPVASTASVGTTRTDN